jgi:hypothetical protein
MDLQTLKSKSPPPVYFGQSYSPGFNVDGFFVIGDPRAEGGHTYSQFFRDGSVEAVLTTIADEKTVYPSRIEKNVIHAATVYVPLLVQSGCEYPFTLSVALLGMKGRVAPPDQWGELLGHKIDGRQLLLQAALPRPVCYRARVVASPSLLPTADEGGPMAKISVGTREELVRALSERYRVAAQAEKRRILDEFVALTGYHRKHAIRVLRAPVNAPEVKARSRVRLYDDAVREALVILWEASDRVCGKRLKPLLPVLLPALERHGHIKLDDEVRARVLTASAATMDRVLAG